MLRSASLTRLCGLLALAAGVGCSAAEGRNVGDEGDGTQLTGGSGGTAAGSGASSGAAPGKGGSSNPGKGGSSGSTSAGGTSSGGAAGSSGNGGGGDAGGASGSGAGGSGGGSAGTGSVMRPPEALAEPQACTSNAPGPRKLWRLSAKEFEASVHSIFNDTSKAAPVGSVFSDPIILGFSLDANALLVQGLTASQLMDSAEAVAAWAASSGQLSQFGNCQTVDKTCAQKFIQAFGRRAFRQTLAADDARVAAYTKLFTTEKDFSSAAQTVVTAMLQSPYFLYRSELGTEQGGSYTLTPFEVASELSYLLTSNTPDDTLLSAADSVAAGSLSIGQMVDQQTDRLIATGSASNATAVMGFMRGWLGLDRLYSTAKDDTVYMLTTAMRDNMDAEAQNLIVEAFNTSGSFGSVLTADHTFVNKDLAAFYGFPTTGLDATFKSFPIPADSPRDSGLLATGAILNGYARPDTSSPTQRGHLVRTRMLCQEIAPPPSDVDTTFHPSDMAQTTRQRFEQSHSTGGCFQCHKHMDLIGFGFEHYDAFGRFRDTENGLPIDDSLQVLDPPSGDGPALAGLSGPNSLGEYLAGSDDVQKCMLRYWTYFAYGSSTWAQDACTYDAIYQEASQASFGLKDVLKAIIHAQNFTTRVKDQ